MPPRTRSSSSHSSGSRSSPSSHSSSSHSSGSSSGQSYSSSRSSSHSYSSHSSGSSFGSSTGTHRPSRHSTDTHKTVPTGGVPIRGRSGQPTGYTRSTPGYREPTTYHCRKHDYRYFAFGWTDTATGTAYEPGYYDENGKYYDEVVFRDKSSRNITMKCEYCGSAVKTQWTKGVQPSCPNCGAGLKVEQADELLTSYKESSDTSEKKKWHPILMAFMAVLLFGGILNREPCVIFFAAAIAIVAAPPVSRYLSGKAMVWTCVGIVLISSAMASTTPEGGSGVNTPSGDNSIYVEVLGRSCRWQNDSEAYYDQKTNCYFWYNTDISPACWQYWYEGISSDFGDYGWMEYDEAEQQWYIEASERNWIVLPEKYRTDHLWHIEE